MSHWSSSASPSHSTTTVTTIRAIADPATAVVKPTSEATGPKRNPHKIHSQRGLDVFWDKLSTKHATKTYLILPDEPSSGTKLIRSVRSVDQNRAFPEYADAAAACKQRVASIAKEYRRMNKKFTDEDFNIDTDQHRHLIYSDVRDTLHRIDQDESAKMLVPRAAKRVEDIFEDPKFTVNGMHENDVQQGQGYDCYFMSAICTLSRRQDLLEKVCIARDEKVGVYGFVFYQNHDWVYEIIDDWLYLTKNDLRNLQKESESWRQIPMESHDEAYKQVMQTGSRALYFAKCKNENTTWLPLLEKAYAKAYGDYASLKGGYVGESLEDLTGGVSSDVWVSDILDKDKFWSEQLMLVNKSFFFGVDLIEGGELERDGIIKLHEYAVLEAREIDDHRLLKIKNPWGKIGWRGPWSDGSKEWTPDYLTRLNYQFGNDGVFWMPYKSFLRCFSRCNRTRLFAFEEWCAVSRWTNISVPWLATISPTYFKFTLLASTPIVIVFSQLDSRLFLGFEGQYTYYLSFSLHKKGSSEPIARSSPVVSLTRSTNLELDDLEVGEYQVLVTVDASRNIDDLTAEDRVKKVWNWRPNKLRTVGARYNAAHKKGGFEETEAERKRVLGQRRRQRRLQGIQSAFEANKLAARKRKLRERRLDAKQTEEDGDEEEETYEMMVGETKVTLTHLSKRVEQRAEADIKRKEVKEVEKPEGEKTEGDRSDDKAKDSEDDKKGETKEDQASIDASMDKTDVSVDEIEELTLADISDTELSYDDEIDAPTRGVDEEELDSDIEPEGGDPDEEEKKVGKDPWNAVAVVGVRVLVKKGLEIGLEVVRGEN